MKTVRLLCLLSLASLWCGTASAQKQACKTEKGQSDNRVPPKQRKQRTCQQRSESTVDQGDEQAKCQKQAGQSEACCCGDQSGGDAGGAGDGKGDDKKQDGGGSGGGSPPQMPQMPQQKKDDSAQKEQARQARIAACKSNVSSNLATAQSNCEVQWSYDPNHPVANQKLEQDKCKQDAILQSQQATAQCDAQNPPGT